MQGQALRDTFCPVVLGIYLNSKCNKKKLKEAFSFLTNTKTNLAKLAEITPSVFLETKVAKSKIQTGAFSVVFLLTWTHHDGFSLHVLEITGASFSIFNHFESCNLAGPMGR